MTIKTKYINFVTKKTISLLFLLFGNNIRIISSKNNNLNTFLLDNLVFILLLKTLLYNLLNTLSMFDNYKL